MFWLVYTNVVGQLILYKFPFLHWEIKRNVHRSHITQETLCKLYKTREGE